jgi:hypothetical protein
VPTRTNAIDPIGCELVSQCNVVQKKDNSKFVVCEIVVGRICAIRVEVYIKYKISLFRDYNVIAVYEFLDDLDVVIDPLERSGVVEIHIREDPLNRFNCGILCII